jgi:hypothetical protein
MFSLRRSAYLTTITYALASGCLKWLNTSADKHDRNFGIYLGLPVADAHCQSPPLTATEGPTALVMPLSQVRRPEPTVLQTAP